MKLSVVNCHDECLEALAFLVLIIVLCFGKASKVSDYPASYCSVPDKCLGALAFLVLIIVLCFGKASKVSDS